MLFEWLLMTVACGPDPSVAPPVRDPVPTVPVPTPAPTTPTDTDTGYLGPAGDPVCGNGVQEVGEQCDDGNDLQQDGCTSDCLVDVECQECRAANCSAFQGYLDVQGLCIGTDVSWYVDNFGATPPPEYHQLCDALVTCMRETGCAYDPGATGDTMPDCYCGPGVSTEDCIKGIGVSGVCQTEWEEAALSTDPMEVAVRFTDGSYASGAAYFLTYCDASLCRDACGP